MNRISPKALNADNLTRGFLEEIHDKNMRNVIQHNQRRAEYEFNVDSSSPALAVGIGFLFSLICGLAAWDLYWLLRIYL